LYEIKNDPGCVNNLAPLAVYAEIKQNLWSQMENELTAQGDPRILGKGEIFDYYPNCRIDRQQKIYEQPNFDPVKTFEEKFGK
jgi:N-sulfoglucosamine sulfohydrolase